LNSFLQSFLALPFGSPWANFASTNDRALLNTAHQFFR